MAGRHPVAVLASATVLTALIACPAALASAPRGPHGVDRDKLERRAESVVEKRRGIEVLRISRCSPRERTRGRLDYSRWTCYWRAEGTWPGEVPYHCAGKARWKRKRDSWRVDRCRNRLQPQVPLLAAPRPRPIFGFNDNWIFESDQALDLLDQSGAQVARMSLPWSGVEPHRGAGNWFGSDRLYDKLLARGIRPLWVLIDAPCWAQRKSRACREGKDRKHPSRRHYDDFARFAVRVARRYPQSIGIEVWNEPNYPRFWGGWPQPDAYARMLREVSRAVHREAPGTPVVSGGLSPHADSDKRAIGFSNFLDRLYRRGAAKWADAIGIHPYPGVGPNEDYVRDVRIYLGKIQRVMRRHHDADRPLWATELGVSTTGEHAFPAALQGPALVDVYGLMSRASGMNIDLALVHRFVEAPGLGGREGGFGVVSQNLVPKPSYCTLLRGLQVAAGAGRC